MAKIALVTGASKGIGRACAIRLAKDGYTVIVNYSSSDAAAQEVVDTIKAAGGEAEAIKADVSNINDMKNVFEKTDMIFPKHSKNRNISGFRQTGETPSPNFDEVI